MSFLPGAGLNVDPPIYVSCACGITDNIIMSSLFVCLGSD
jgi:hypothetical protein